MHAEWETMQSNHYYTILLKPDGFNYNNRADHSIIVTNTDYTLLCGLTY